MENWIVIPAIYEKYKKKVIYKGKSYSMDEAGIHDVFTQIDYLHLSYQDIKLPTVIGNYVGRVNIDKGSFFMAEGFLDIAQWCLCNRDLTQPLFEKHGFDNMTPTRKAFSSICGQGSCNDEKWGILLEDFFKQCKREAM